MGEVKEQDETGHIIGMKRQKAIVAILWIILGATISIWSATFPFGSWKALGPAIFPLASGLILIIGGSIQLFQLFQTRKQHERNSVEKVPIIPHGSAFIRVTLSLGGMILSAIFLEVIGFVLTIFCLTLFLLRILQPQKWRVHILYASVFTVSCYVLFRVLLDMRLPIGFLGF